MHRLPSWCGYREQASPTKCARSIADERMASSGSATTTLAHSAIVLKFAALHPLRLEQSMGSGDLQYPLDERQIKNGPLLVLAENGHSIPILPCSNVVSPRCRLQ